MADHERLHALDAVRAFALLLGVVFHAAMSFLPGFGDVGWPLADRSPSATLALVFYTSHMFRMTTFFFIAGLFARLVLQRHGARSFFKDRSKRILIPLVAGWVILLPLTLIALFWGGTKSGITEPPPVPDGARLPFPLIHLWFLYLLFLIYLVFVPLCTFVSRVIDREGRVAARLDSVVSASLRLGFAPVLLAVPVAAALYAYAPWLPWGGIPTPDSSLIPNSPAIIAYGTAFVFGWLLHRQLAVLAFIARHWIAYLAAALACTASCLYLVGLTPMLMPIDAQLPLAAMERLLYAIAYGLGSWCWTLAITGAALTFLSRERPMIRYLADSSYWLYLVHLPLVFALQAWMMHWELHWTVKYPLIVSLATGLLLLSYDGIVRSTFIGAILNGRRHPRRLTVRRTVAHVGA